MSEHPRDPLEYLYEELPPERMAETKKHLASCPPCRADMRAVRETVKAYRQADKPAAPAGLATRTARAALEEARRSGAVSPSPKASAPRERHERSGRPHAAAPFAPPPKRPVGPECPTAADLDREFARLKEEVLREIPKGWRTWLFHPAWTVAAAVIFLCALLIHFSPRLNQLETRFLPSMPLTRDDDVVRRIRERERLPASQPRRAGDAVPGAAGAAPILQEAVAINAIPEVPVAAARLISVRPAVQPDEQPDALPDAQPAAEPVQPDERPAPEPGDSGPELPPGPTPIGVLESLGEKTRALAGNGDARVVILNGPDAAAAPQLIERPPAYDPAERIRSLTALAGMQMASGEFVDAWQTVGLLERYDDAAAAALGVTLRDVEKAVRAKDAAPPPEQKPEQKPEPEPEPVPAHKPEPEPAPEPDAALIVVPPEEPSSAAPRPAPPQSVPSALESVPAAPAYAPHPEALPEPVELPEPPEDPPLSFVWAPIVESVPEPAIAIEESVSLPPVEPPEIPILLPGGNGPWAGSRESAYVDTPVVRGIGTGEPTVAPQGTPGTWGGAAATYPAAVYAPAVPVVIVPAPIPASPVQTRAFSPGRRPFTTDPYFRDY